MHGPAASSSSAAASSSSASSVVTSNDRLELSRGRSYIGSLNARKKPHGVGTKFDRAGRIIAQCSNWIDGKMNGVGFQQLDTGGRYSGSFRNGLWHGLGLFVSEDGHQFEGTFVGGVQQGLGRRTHPDGSTSEGQYADNVLSGYGAHWNREGKLLFMGRYDHGPKRSEAIPRSVLPAATFLSPAEKHASLLYPSGEFYIGAFNENVPHGAGAMYRSNGAMIEEGYWQNGLYVGRELLAEGDRLDAAEKEREREAAAARDSAEPEVFNGLPLHLVQPDGPAALLKHVEQAASHTARGGHKS